MWIMRRKTDGQYFIIKRIGTGLGDLMTSDPNKACLYNMEWPGGYTHIRRLWEPVEVNVQVTIKS